MTTKRTTSGWLFVLGLAACVTAAIASPVTAGSGAQTPTVTGTAIDPAVPVAMQIHPGPGPGIGSTNAVQPVALAHNALDLPMGVSLLPMSRALAQAQGIRYSSGGYVATVTPGSPAERAGLVPGDIVNRINGQ